MPNGVSELALVVSGADILPGAARSMYAILPPTDAVQVPLRRSLTRKGLSRSWLPGAAATGRWPVDPTHFYAVSHTLFD